MSIKFSQCAAIYGVSGMTAQETFIALSKHYKSVALVTEEDTVPYHDIIIIDTVHKLMSLRHTINTNMIILVCDSIVNLETIKDSHPFDYTGKFSSSWEMVKPKWKVEKEPIPVEIKLKTKSPLDMALGKLNHSRFLSEYNSITSHMNKPARSKFRKLLHLHMKDRRNKEVIEFIQSILKGSFKDQFIEMLKSSYFDKLCAAVWSVKRKELTAEAAQAIHKLDDSYEIVYLVKLVEEMQ